jgi:hypothetical protein
MAIEPPAALAATDSYRDLEEKPQRSTRQAFPLSRN